AGNYSFPALTDHLPQSLVINSLAFIGGCAYAAFHYLGVRGPSETKVDDVPKLPRTWRVRGTAQRFHELNAAEIEQALRNGQDIDVRFAAIQGELNFQRVAKQLIHGQITFRNCRFLGRVIGSYLTFDSDVSFLE